MSSNYLQQLNPEQQQAILHTEGPTMIIAGAGSGKTRVLTYRIAHLIEKGTQPYQILSLTFTNKAAREMRERIEGVVGHQAKNIWMGTFHSVFSRILRMEADKLGFPANYTIYDSDDSKSLLRQIIKNFGLDDKAYKVNQVLGRISIAKNSLVSAERYNTDPLYYEDDEKAGRPEMGRIYKEYVRRCQDSGAMDFDDLLYNTNLLFRDHPDVLQKYQQKFGYILVDEYQDTNVSQYLITKKIADQHQNLCIVGDDAQSIYAFRGANIQNILNFEQDYPKTRRFRLEQNYRSTQVIVRAANAVIKNNSGQIDKEVWTENPEGEKINLIKATSDNEEARQIANAIYDQKLNEGFSLQDFAILYRTNSQSRALEEALRRMGLRYKIIGGLSFYQRKEIKDLLAYLRFLANPQDEEAFRRIINYPKRGIGDTTVAKLLALAQENQKSVWEVAQQAPHYMSGRAANKVFEFAQLVERFRKLAEKENAFEVAKAVARETGISKELYEDQTPEGTTRYENLQELLNAIQEFTENPEVEDTSLGAFLQEVTLVTDADNKDTDEDAITLMTIHMAKGLEFKSVFIAGMEENLFPSQMMLASREDLEEERRLFYVAMTRAEQRLSLSYATTRYRYGSLRECEPSRFLDEVAADCLKMERRYQPEAETASAGSNGQGHVIGSGKKRQAGPKPAAKGPAPRHQVSEGFSPTPAGQIGEGQRVEHPKFGFGRVAQVEDTASGRKAVVDFDQAGSKTLLLTFAKLMLVE